MFAGAQVRRRQWRVHAAGKALSAAHTGRVRQGDNAAQASSAGIIDQISDAGH
jgi:hypothetical protein